jgi:TonB family protein
MAASDRPAIGIDRAHIDTPLRPTRKRLGRIGVSLAAALAASVAVHATLVLIPAGSGALQSRAAASPMLSARLVAPEAAAAVQSIAKLLPAPIIPEMAPLAPTRLRPVDATIEARSAPEPGNARAGIATPRAAVATPLTAYARLGDLQARWQSEFPVEVEFPVRLHDEISVPYPPAALERRIEGDVVVWAIVNPDGTVEDVQIVEGDQIFRDAIVAALRDARYYPAANRGENIRYPMALELNFSLGEQRRDGSLAAVPAR